MATKWRVVQWAKDKIPGSATTKDATEEVRSKEPSPTLGTRVTEAMEQARSKIFPSSQKSTTPASGTGKSGLGSMEWTESPLCAVEHSLILLDNSSVDLSPLTESEQAALLKLSAGTGEPVVAVIHNICRYLTEAEHPVAEGTVLDAVRWYLTHEIL